METSPRGEVAAVRRLRERLGPLTGIILAGGESRRMGTDKSLLDLGSGLSTVKALARQLAPLVDGLLVVTSAERLDAFEGLRSVADEIPGQGPLMAIASGLEASDTELNFVVACDIPVVHVGALADLLARAEEREVVVPSFEEGFREPLFGVYRRSVLGRARECLVRGLRRVGALFDLCRTSIVPIADASWYANLNTRADLSAYVARTVGKVQEAVE